MNQIFERGRIVRGKVTGITNYGIFVGFDNGYKGLIHISEISDNFVKDINNFAKIGEIIPCKIFEIDSQNKVVKLTLKKFDYEYRRESHYNKDFEILKEKLPYWISYKIKEINKNGNII
ncbi:MAG: S1 RNA-binding domain-containing protein [Bacilli bacterium]|nr:S1 RNA-binding domain-containing protein [Bacilli bacterium]